jgi:hypothetical protein
LRCRCAFAAGFVVALVAAVVAAAAAAALVMPVLLLLNDFFICTRFRPFGGHSGTFESIPNPMGFASSTQKMAEAVKRRNCINTFRVSCSLF